MVTIHIKRKEVVVFSFLLVILFFAGISVSYQSGETPSDLGHSGEEFQVNTSSGSKSLQQAIDDGDIGGSGGGSIGSGSGSFADDGYYQLDDGLIIQWGETPSISGDYVVTYPIPFPNEVFSVIATAKNIGGEQAESGVENVGNIQFTLDSKRNRPYYWHAVGH